MTEPLPSIIIMMLILVAGVVYYVAYIFRMAYIENEVSVVPDSPTEHDPSPSTGQGDGFLQQSTGECETVSLGTDNDST